MKRILYIYCVFSVILITLLTACAEEKGEDSFLSSQREEIYSSLDPETRDILSDLGIDDISEKALLDIGFSDFISAFTGLFKSNLSEYIKDFMYIFGLLAVLSAAEKLSNGKESPLSDVFSAVVILCLASRLRETAVLVAGVFHITGKFMLSFVPVITAILSFSGNITFSAIYSSMTIALAQCFCILSDIYILPLTGIYFSLIISMSLNGTVKGDKVCSFINRISSFSLGFVSFLFTLLISVKNILAKDVDGILFKSGKYILTNAVPVIGTALGGIFNTVIGSLDLMKSTVGIFAVTAIAAVNLPVLLKLFMSFLSLTALGAVSDTIGEGRASAMLRGFASSVRFLGIVLIFQLALVIISTGLAVCVRGEL